MRWLAVATLGFILSAAAGVVSGVNAESITARVVVNPLAAGLSLSATVVDRGVGFEAFGLIHNQGASALHDVVLVLRGDAQLAIDAPLRAIGDVAGAGVHAETWTLCGEQPGSYLLLMTVDAIGAGPHPFTLESPAVLVDILPVPRACGAFAFGGFYSPIENPPVVNLGTAGSGVPVKFSLGGDQGLDIFGPGYPASRQIACDGTAQLDAVEETATAGTSGLSYDPLTQVYTYVWKTKKPWAGTCRQLSVGLIDGTIHVADFKFRK